MSHESWLSRPGLACASVGLGFFLLSRGVDARAAHLASATVLGRIDEANALEAALPLLVVLRGRADSTNPKACELSDAKAVYHELQEEDILVTRSAAGHAVRNPFEMRRELTATDWFLEDGSGTRVRVEGTRGAQLRHDALEMRQDYKERTDGQGLQTLAQFFTGHKVQGYRRKETYIPVGAILTVIGELSRNALAGTGGGARYAVRAPRGADLIISSHTLEQLHKGLSKLSNLYRGFAAAFGGVGAVLIARRVVKLWLRRRREAAAKRMLKEASEKVRAARRARAAAAAAVGSGEGAAAAGGADAAAEGQEGDREEDLCVVCLTEEACNVYTACGHMCVCKRCRDKLRRCPVCRTASDCIRVYRM